MPSPQSAPPLTFAPAKEPSPSAPEAAPARLHELWWRIAAGASVLLCIETGAMCEAHKYNELVTHCLCVVREDERSPFTVLSPCGVCQERLRYWGEDVRVGVTTDDGSLKFVALGEMQPWHWSGAYPPGELEHYKDLHLDLG